VAQHLAKIFPGFFKRIGNAVRNILRVPQYFRREAVHPGAEARWKAGPTQEAFRCFSGPRPFRETPRQTRSAGRRSNPSPATHRCDMRVPAKQALSKHRASIPCEKHRPAQRAQCLARWTPSVCFSSTASCAGPKPLALSNAPRDCRTRRATKNGEHVEGVLALAGPAATIGLSRRINHLEGSAAAGKFHVETSAGVLPRVDRDGGEAPE
jgi:hypothetical protein